MPSIVILLSAHKFANRCYDGVGDPEPVTDTRAPTR